MTSAADQDRFEPVVLMPTYNNAATLEQVMAAVEALGLRMMVVNDGCTDGTAQVLLRWAARAELLHHSVNQGKAAALKTGFAAASAQGFTHAVTLDTDGQHDPSDLPRLLKVAEQNPDALVLGTRSRVLDNYPRANLLGRRLSNAAIRLQSGVRVEDCQCGLRVYPLSLMREIKVGAGRYGFEAEVITRASWAGCAIVEADVSCTYAPEGTRVSHYVPWRDSPRAVVMHLRLLIRSLVPFPHRKWSKFRRATHPAARDQVPYLGGP